MEKHEVESAILVIDRVLLYLVNNKRKAIEHLFKGASEDYLDEWRGRNPVDFWFHLDLNFRRMLVKIAVQNYAND